MSDKTVIEIQPRFDDLYPLFDKLFRELADIRSRLSDENDIAPVPQKFAAEQIGVSETTVRNWLRLKPNFGRVIEGKKVVTLGDIKRAKRGEV